MCPNAQQSLPASVEERLSGWVRIQERRGPAPAAVRTGPAITLSRAYGCSGFPLALRLQARLQALDGEDWSVFDRGLLDKVAEEEGIPARLLEQLGSPARSLEAFGFHPLGRVTRDEAYAKLADTLVKVARRGHAIIVGRGGAALCRNLEGAFHFRLEASEAWRIAEIQRRYGVGRAEAEEQVRRESRRRDQYIQERLGVDVKDHALYDAVFNNERQGVEPIAEAILALVRAALA